MQVYNALPHLAFPVVTDPKKVLLALRWVIEEMEKRYKMFATRRRAQHHQLQRRGPRRRRRASETERRRRRARLSA